MARENVNIRADIAQWWEICRDGVTPLIDAEDIEFIEISKGLLPSHPWDETTWKAWTTLVKDITGRKGKGLFMPLRKALTAMEHGPDMAKLLPLLQKINI